MPTMGVARNLVSVPAPEVARGGIMAAARVVDSTDPHDMLGAEYLSDACASVEQWNLYCANDPGETEKLFEEGAEVVEGDPFTLYAGVQCTLQKLDEAADRARNRFNYGERAGVDSAVSMVLNGIAIDLPDVTEPLPVGEAIGALENFMTLRYGGVPTLLVPMPVIGCSCKNGLISRNLDGSLVTCSGSNVANVAVLTNTPRHIYASGQITLLRGALSVISVPQQPLGDGTYAPPRALAERTYVPLIECLAVKVEVTCE